MTTLESPATAATARASSVVASGVTATTPGQVVPARSLHTARHRSQEEVRNNSTVRPSPGSNEAGVRSGAVPEKAGAGRPTREVRSLGTAADASRALPAATAGRACRRLRLQPSRLRRALRASLRSVKIGVLGATGPAGQAVAVQLAAIGETVLVGSRALERAEHTVGELRERWPGRRLDLLPGDNETAAEADVVVVATPWEGVLSTVSALEEKLAAKTVVSMANALTRWGGEMVPLLPPTGSVTAAVARVLPRSKVVGAFHHLPAGPWSDLDHPLDADVLVCSDHRDAARQVVDLVDRLPGLRGVDVGGLASALAIEALTPALLEVNRRYKTHAAIRLTGLP